MVEFYRIVRAISGEFKPYHHQQRVTNNVLYMTAIAVTPYLCFLFFGGGYNPFIKPRSSSKRSRWKRGRAMGMAAILGIVCAMIISRMLELPSPVAFSVGVVMSLLFATVFSAKKISRYLWGRK